MSGYQYFEFQAIDQPLSRAQMDELRRWSSRARITPSGFVNEYHYGDFKGSPDRWMTDYFDAFLHIANWGTRWLMLRLPRGLVSEERLFAYCSDEAGLTSREAGEQLILSFYATIEDHDWVEGDGWLAALTPLRSALLGGDTRCLYLGWLLGMQMGEVADEDREPPVPPGLGELDESLRSFADFFRLDADLLAVAAECSAPMDAQPLSEDGLRCWVGEMSVAEKDAMLCSILTEERPSRIQSQLLQLRSRARRALNTASLAAPPPVSERRTAQALRMAAATLTEQRRQARTARQARETAQREAEAAKRRKLYLQSRKGTEDQLWQEVEQLIDTRQPNAYDRAVSLLQDLHDLAGTDDTTDAFGQRMQGLIAQHLKKRTLIERLRSARLVP